MPRNRPSAGSIGLPGGNYANRTDKAVPTGLPYGEAGKLTAALAAVPVTGAPPSLAAPGAPIPPPAPAPPPPGGGGPAVSPMAQILAAAQSTPPPNQSLFSPTGRPGEPVTAGLASGPGPGPEALQMIGPSATTMTYQTLADATGSPLLRQLAALSAAADRSGPPQ